MRKIKRLNEEIARWAFEILFNDETEWKIVFTNPTAGPWKTIKAKSKITNKEGEVYRFILEEDRPDIVMYNDVLETVIIFEAKDDLEKLIKERQSRKSAEVVVKLAKLFNGLASNEFWKGRENYKVIVGLLWGATKQRENDLNKNKLYDCYYELVKNEQTVFSDIIVGVETLYNMDELKCKVFYKAYDNKYLSEGEKIVNTLISHQ